MRRGWLVGVLAALGALWLLALDAVWNITAGLINMEVHRWWLIPTTIAMTVITSVATGIVRYVDHKRRPHIPPTTPPLISAAGDSHVEVQHSQVGGHGNTLINVAVGSAEQLSPAVVDAPAGLHNLPNPSTVFVGRDLAAVEHTLSGGAGAIGQAVHGLGGVGKSELATHYAHAHPDRYRLRWWITADTVDNITLGLTELTQRLHPLPDLTTAAAWAITWLQTHPHWLLILDNVEEPDHIAPLLGTLRGYGHVLITTRRDLGTARWTQLGLAPLHLQVLNRTASIALLHRLTGDHNDTTADRLAEDLGDLPLALEQAAAYITQNPGLDLAGYQHLLAQYPAQVHAAASPGTNPDRAVNRVWQITMNTITGSDPAAAHLLAVLSYLAPDNLPENILTPLANTPVDLNNTLTLLASYSMISRAGGLVSVHRLVQTITRAAVNTPSDGELPTPLSDAITSLAKAAPDQPLTNVDGWPRWKTLTPHIAAVTSHLPTGHHNTTILQLGEQAATYLKGQGQLAPAITLYEQVLTDRRRVLGDDRPDTLNSRNNLASAYRSAGRVAEAITLYEQVFTDTRRVLGEGHPNTLGSRHNLAGAYFSAGRVAEAITLYEQVLTDTRRVLGDDHPNTLTSRNSLAGAYRSAGRVAEAITLYEQVLTDRRRVLGDDHPNTLTSRNSLAGAYQTAGRVAEAITLYEQVLTDRRRVLGDDHPDTLGSRNSLASAYQTAGRVAEAITLYEQALTDTRRVLGEDHPIIKTIASNLAEARQKKE